MSAAVIEQSSEHRRHARDEAMARGLVATLERQAREIVEFAAATERDDTVHGFARYQMFRRRVEEFDSLCSVIEAWLRKLTDEPRGALKELFRTRRDMILGPSIRATSAFFTRLAENGDLPLGVFDILDAELRSLETMREALDADEAPAPDAAEIRTQIEQIEAIIKDLKGRASQFPDFSDPDAVEDALPPEETKSEGETLGSLAAAEAAEAAAAGEAHQRDTPELRAVRNIREILEPLLTDHLLGHHAEIDVRALADIERRLIKDANDESAAKWLRHLCSAWSSRLRAKETVLLRILDEIS